jgi:dCTP diphosphatase
MSDLIGIRDEMRAFTEERDWGRYHDPKSLVLALVGEVGELAEIFQWLPAEQAMELAGAQPLRKRVAEELADVLVYLVRLADVLDVDLGEATRAKLHAARGRYPVGDVHGQAPVKS